MYASPGHRNSYWPLADWQTGRSIQPIDLSPNCITTQTRDGYGYAEVHGWALGRRLSSAMAPLLPVRRLKDAVAIAMVLSEGSERRRPLSAAYAFSLNTANPPRRAHAQSQSHVSRLSLPLHASELSDEASTDSADEDVLDLQTLQHLLDDSDVDVPSSSAATDGDEDDPSSLPAGLIDGFFVVCQYQTPESFDLSAPNVQSIDASRVGLTSTNVTLPIALMLIDPTEFPSLSKARKAIRQKSIALYRPSADKADGSPDARVFPRTVFERPSSTIGRVSDRVVPGDVIGRQKRLSHGLYSKYIGLTKPSFDLPVLYEDDHIAVVNKPAGVLVYGGSEGGQGRNNVRFALPHYLKPPSKENEDIGDVSNSNMLRRPVTCHRLDMPTSGVLVCAKTMQAVVDVTRQFEHRVVRKTYNAIVDGRLECGTNDAITSKEAYDLGVDVDPNDDSIRWQIADDIQEGKVAVTVWRVLRHVQSTKSSKGWVTLVEMKPKTGRKHQLRRHMAWNYNCPIVGDTTYGDAYDAKRFGRGLMLSSCHISFHHPYYSNSDVGQKEWERISFVDEYGDRRFGNELSQAAGENNPVFCQVSIKLPNKFQTFLRTEERRAESSPPP